MPDASDSMALWMRRLKLRHLEVLLAVADAGSLTGAARVLETSQPAVSQWLGDIEAALEVKLYLRRRQLVPTAHLEPVVRYARRMVNDSRRLQSELALISTGRAGGLVRIGAMHVAGPELMPRAIRAMKAEAPGVMIELVEDIAAGLWPRFERNELDVIVTRLDARAFAAGIESEALYEDSHRVIAGSGHALLRLRRPRWADTARFPWILPPKGTSLRRALDSTFVGEGVVPPAAWLESVAMTTNEALLVQTDCLAIVSSAIAQHLQTRGSVGITPLRLGAEVGSVGMVWRDVAPTPPIALTLQALREVARSR